ncbi:MAG: MmgE/PrpD family protein [Planctomycetota bacterium]
MTATATAQRTDTHVTLPADSNQALGIAEYAIAFMAGELGDGPAETVFAMTRRFHTDAVFCGVSALALGTNAPTVLQQEALAYPAGIGERGASVFGSTVKVKCEKAILANNAAVREWDSNGTNFGYNPALGHTAGEFGHNDFYSVAVSACQATDRPGSDALRAMILHDEIRGRLAEVFSLKSYKIDHVVHGAIASAAVYGALCGATAEQIESAIGMTVAHFIPWRAIRAGKQLSDSKGASAAISSEVAVLAMERAMRGFIGPKDIFRNPEAIFRFFEPTTEGDQRWTELAPSPFDLVLAHSGDDFAVMGMHFKLGLYEHQSAGAIQGLINLVAQNPDLASSNGDNITGIHILAYEPAFGIIGNPAKMDPTTRQSADHSMAYIVSTALRKAVELKAKGELPTGGPANCETWKPLMLSPWDYKTDESAIHHPLTRSLMSKITFEHGGKEYDDKYPDGIPTSLKITDASGTVHDSGFIMYPIGHARHTEADLDDMLAAKWAMLGEASGIDIDTPRDRLDRIGELDSAEMQSVYAITYTPRSDYE